MEYSNQRKNRHGGQGENISDSPLPLLVDLHAQPTNTFRISISWQWWLYDHYATTRPILLVEESHTITDYCDFLAISYREKKKKKLPNHTHTSARKDPLSYLLYIFFPLQSATMIGHDSHALCHKMDFLILTCIGPNPLPYRKWTIPKSQPWSVSKKWRGNPSGRSSPNSFLQA